MDHLGTNLPYLTVMSCLVLPLLAVYLGSIVWGL